MVMQAIGNRRQDQASPVTAEEDLRRKLSESLIWLAEVPLVVEVTLSLLHVGKSQEMRVVAELSQEKLVKAQLSLCEATLPVVDQVAVSEIRAFHRFLC